MNAEADRDQQRELRNLAAITTANRLLGLLVDCESGLRGYAATGMPVFAEPYEHAVGLVPIEVDRLRRLSPERSRPLEGLAASALEYNRTAIAMLRRGERQTVLASIAAQDGKRRMDAFRAAMARFLDAEQREEDKGTRRWDGMRKHLALAAAGGAAVVIALTAALSIAFTRDVLKRLHVVRDNTLRLERGEPLHALDGRGDEIAAVDHSFHEMAAALQRERSELEAFTYSVSHDLRAPLRAMNGFAEILAEDYGGALDADGWKSLQVIRSEARRMGVLIDDLLAFSRLGKSPLTLATVDIAQLARDVWIDLPDKDGAALEIAALPKARCDRATVRQLLVNLLSNAVKFSRNSPETRVEIGGHADGGQNIYWIRDHGAGFDMRYSGKLFGVFQRMHTQDEFEGTGVGLAIVARVVTRHGGRVWADSAPGAGACFSFTLPAAKEERS